MRTEVVAATEAHEQPRRWIGGVLCHDLRAADGSTLIAKGHRLERADDVLLEAAADQALHLLFLEAGDLDEDTAAVRLAAAVAGPGLDRSRPVESQVNCRARSRGLVTVDVAALESLNGCEGITVFTLPDGMPVEAGRSAAGVKITPLGIPEADLNSALARVPAAPVVDLLPFTNLVVGVVVCEGLSPQRRDRFEEALRAKLRWLGGDLRAPRYLPSREAASPGAMAEAARGTALLLVAGVASTDPLDPPLQALLRAGAQVVRRGLPAHPGSSYWVLQLGDCTVVGVASCGMFSRRTILDILLCRRFAGGPLDERYLSRLGHGGLLARELGYRFPDYSGDLPPDDR